LQQALRLDPNFALAWSALAELYTNDSIEWGRIFPPDAGAGQKLDLAATNFLLGTDKVSVAAHEAGARALALDPDEADIHRAMSCVLLWFDFNWAAADAGLSRARELDPVNARISEQSARLAITLGRPTEGLAFANAAVRLDPLGTAYWQIGAAQYRLGALEQAAAAYRRVIELHPTIAGAYFRHGMVLLSQHLPQAALEQIQRDEPWYRSAGTALALDALGRRTDSDRALAIAERDWGTGMAYQISYVYAARGEAEQALTWLERAYRQRDAGLLSITNDPMLQSLESNPSFKALLRKLKLPG
jgi:tetratricopeptide (TPR) repeat protein